MAMASSSTDSPIVAFEKSLRGRFSSLVAESNFTLGDIPRGFPKMMKRSEFIRLFVLKGMSTSDDFIPCELAAGGLDLNGEKITANKFNGDYTLLELALTAWERICHDLGRPRSIREYVPYMCVTPGDFEVLYASETAGARIQRSSLNFHQSKSLKMPVSLSVIDYLQNTCGRCGTGMHMVSMSFDDHIEHHVENKVYCPFCESHCVCFSSRPLYLCPFMYAASGLHADGPVFANPDLETHAVAPTATRIPVASVPSSSAPAMRSDSDSNKD